MVKISEMNLFLHGASEPKIHEYDTLTSDDKWGEKYECILANPPFMTPKGGIIPHNKFSIKSSKSEILFVDYINNHLTSQGKAGIIVPDGVVFKQDRAFESVRKDLLENSLWGVVSLPSGIFQPYAGVSTNILLLDKRLAKERDKVLFVELNNDGYSLSTQRKPVKRNQIPELVSSILKYKNDMQYIDNNIILVSKSDIKKNDYDLSINLYKEPVITNTTFRKSSEVAKEIIELKEIINQNLEKLRELL